MNDFIKMAKDADIRLRRDFYSTVEAIAERAKSAGYHLSGIGDSTLFFERTSNGRVDSLSLYAGVGEVRTAVLSVGDGETSVLRTFFVYKERFCASLSEWNELRDKAARRESLRQVPVRSVKPQGELLQKVLRKHHREEYAVNSIILKKIKEADNNGVETERLTATITFKTAKVPHKKRGGGKPDPIIAESRPVAVSRYEKERRKGISNMVEVHGRYVPAALVDSRKGAKEGIAVMLATRSGALRRSDSADAGFIIILPDSVYGSQYIAVDSNGMLIHSGYIPCDGAEVLPMIRKGAVGTAPVRRWIENEMLNFTLMEWSGDGYGKKTAVKCLPFGVLRLLFGDEFFINGRPEPVISDVTAIKADEWNSAQSVSLSADGVADICGIKSRVVSYLLSLPKEGYIATDLQITTESGAIITTESGAILTHSPCIEIRCRATVSLGSNPSASANGYATSADIDEQAADILRTLREHPVPGSEDVPAAVIEKITGDWDECSNVMRVVPYEATDDGMSACVKCLQHHNNAFLAVKGAGTHGDMSVYISKSVWTDPWSREKSASIIFYLYDTIKEKVVKEIGTREEFALNMLRDLVHTDSAAYR